MNMNTWTLKVFLEESYSQISDEINKSWSADVSFTQVIELLCESNTTRKGALLYWMWAWYDAFGPWYVLPPTTSQKCWYLVQHSLSFDKQVRQLANWLGGCREAWRLVTGESVESLLRHQLTWSQMWEPGVSFPPQDQCGMESQLFMFLDLNHLSVCCCWSTFSY